MIKTNVHKKLEKINILLLDNSAQVTSLFKKMLVEFGFTKIFVAHNGFQSVSILSEVKIHLIITDWSLEVLLPLSGIDFVRRLRQSPMSPNPFIPIIMFTDMADKIQTFAARDAGVNEVCIKPLDAEELCEKLMTAIDHPRIFITAITYKGPCRRRHYTPLSSSQEERRFREVRVVRNK